MEQKLQLDEVNDFNTCKNVMNQALVQKNKEDLNISQQDTVKYNEIRQIDIKEGLKAKIFNKQVPELQPKREQVLDLKKDDRQDSKQEQEQSPKKLTYKLNTTDYNHFNKYTYNQSLFQQHQQLQSMDFLPQRIDQIDFGMEEMQQFFYISNKTDIQIMNNRHNKRKKLFIRSINSKYFQQYILQKILDSQEFIQLSQEEKQIFPLMHLGKGGYGHVISVYSINLCEIFALKKYGSENKSEHSNYKSERNMMDQIKRLKLYHQNIEPYTLKVIDCNNQQETILFEQADISLDKYINLIYGQQQDIQTGTQFVQTLIQFLVAGIIQLSQAGLYHFDIKPGNIVIKNNQFYYIDLFGAQTDIGEIKMYTPHYLPEFIRAKVNAKNEKDYFQCYFFSIGLTALEVLIKCYKQFCSQNFFENLLKIIKDNQKNKQEFRNQVEQLLNQLQKQLDDSFTTILQWIYLLLFYEDCQYEQIQQQILQNYCRQKDKIEVNQKILDLSKQQQLVQWLQVQYADTCNVIQIIDQIQILKITQNITFFNLMFESLINMKLGYKLNYYERIGLFIILIQFQNNFNANSASIIKFIDQLNLFPQEMVNYSGTVSNFYNYMKILLFQLKKQNKINEEFKNITRLYIKFEIARAYQNDGYISKAIYTFNQLLEQILDCTNPHRNQQCVFQFNILVSLSQLHLDIGQPKLVSENLQKIKQLIEENDLQQNKWNYFFMLLTYKQIEAQLFFSEGNISRALNVLNSQKQLLIEKKITIENSPQFAYNLQLQSQIQGYLNNYPAQYQLNEQAYLILKNIRPLIHPDQIQYLKQKSQYLGKIGNHQQETYLKQEIVNFCNQQYKKQHPEIYRSYNDLAFGFRRLQECQKALENIKIAYQLYTESKSNNFKDQAQIYTTYARILQDKGDHKQALNYQLNVHELIMNNNCNQNDNFFKDSCSNLGSSYFRIGNYQKALKYYDMSLGEQANQFIKKISFQNYQSENQRIDSLTVNFIGQLLQQMDMCDVALNFHLNSVELRLNLVNKMHLFFGQNFDHIGYCLMILNEMELSYECLMISLKIREVGFPQKRNVLKAYSYYNIAQWCRIAKRYQDSEDYILLALENYHESIDSNSVQYLKTVTEKAILYSETGKLNEAIQIYNLDILNQQRESSKEQDRITLTVLVELCFCYSKLNHTENANICAARAVSIINTDLDYINKSIAKLKKLVEEYNLTKIDVEKAIEFNIQEANTSKKCIIQKNLLSNKDDNILITNMQYAKRLIQQWQNLNGKNYNLYFDKRMS